MIWSGGLVRSMCLYRFIEVYFFDTWARCAMDFDTISAHEPKNLVVRIGIALRA